MEQARLKLILDRYLPDAKVVGYKIVDQGAENTTVIVSLSTGRVVVRVLGEHHSAIGVRKDEDIKSELSFMEYCRTGNIPVPRVFRSKADNLYEVLPNGTKCIMMDYVEGEAPCNFNRPMIATVAETMARMHNLVKDYEFSDGRSWPGSILDTTLTRIKNYQKLGRDSSDPNRQLLHKSIDKFGHMQTQVDVGALPQGVIHGDIMWQNIKFSGTKLTGILDFDDCRYSYFIEDIAKSVIFDFDIEDRSMFGFDGQKADIFVREYRRVRVLSALELRALPLFYLARFIYQLTKAYERLETQSPDHITRAIKLYVKNQRYFELR
jgi:homoserine kinase type II